MAASRSRNLPSTCGPDGGFFIIADQGADVILVLADIEMVHPEPGELFLELVLGIKIAQQRAGLPLRAPDCSISADRLFARRHNRACPSLACAACCRSRISSLICDQGLLADLHRRDLRLRVAPAIRHRRLGLSWRLSQVCKPSRLRSWASEVSAPQLNRFKDRDIGGRGVQRRRRLSYRMKLWRRRRRGGTRWRAGRKKQNTKQACRSKDAHEAVTRLPPTSAGLPVILSVQAYRRLINRRHVHGTKVP